MRSVLLMLAMLVPTAIFAGRTEYLVKHDGAMVPDADICFFKMAPAGADPRSSWFFSNDVRCSRADTLLEIPPGRFQFFARSPKYVSSRKHALSNPGGQSPDAYRGVEVPVTAAAYLDFSGVPRLKQQHFAVLVGSTNDEPGALLPARDEEVVVAIPAGRAVVPMIIQDQVPVAIGDVVTLRANETRAASVGAPRSGRGNVVAWISLSSLGAPSFGAVETHLVTARGERFSPLLPLGVPNAIHGALQIYRDVRIGRVSILLDGKHWEKAEAVGTLESGRTLVMDEPILAAPAGVISGRMVIDGALPPTAAAEQTCASPPAPRPVRFALYRCDDPDALDPLRCTAIERREVALSEPLEFSFERLPVGKYFVEAAHPILGAARKRALSTPAEVEYVTLPVSSGFPIFGRVTYGKTTPRAIVRFAGGTKAAGSAATNADGRYEVILPSNPKANAVEVVACDGSFEYTFQPESALAPNAAFDIAVPATVLRVEVKDGATGEAIANAVSFCTVGEGDTSLRLRAESDAAGIARFTSLPSATPLTICASAQARGYVRERCAPTIQLAADEQRTIDLSLTKDGVQRGRLVSSIAFDPPILALVSREGAMRQRVRVSTDGTFWLDRALTPGDYFVLTGPAAPLFVLPQPTMSNDEFVLNVPPARVRNFLLRAPGTEQQGRTFALAIDGRHVPQGLLLLHLHNNRSDPGAPWKPAFAVVGIAETGPIAVTLGPTVAGASPAVPAGVDVFAQPEFATAFETQVLPSSRDEIVFARR